jgi:RecA-family ATPase
MNTMTPAAEMFFEGYPLPARGASLKVGQSKSGKTILAVQEALAIAQGKPLFDYYPVLKPGPVMVVQQDDPNGTASVKDILKACGAPEDIPFFFVPHVPFCIGPALLTWLKQQITARSLKFVVLDSYTALRGPRGPGVDIVKVEQTELTMLDELSLDTGIGIAMLHHGSKASAGLDWTLNGAGTFAMSMSTEAQVHVSRFDELNGGEPERLIRIRGRHSTDLQLALRFRKETMNYQHVLEGGAAEMYPLLKRIKIELGQQPFGIKELSQATGVSRATAYRQIDRLRQAGALIRRQHQYILDVGMTL